MPSDRVTGARVAVAAVRLATFMRANGLITSSESERVRVQPGNRNNGHSWRLYLDDENGIPRDFFSLGGVGGGYLGRTAREALATLDGLFNGVRIAVNLIDRNNQNR